VELYGSCIAHLRKGVYPVRFRFYIGFGGHKPVMLLKFPERYPGSTSRSNLIIPQLWVLEWGGPKTDRSSSIALNTMCVEDWAILGLEASVAGVLTRHPAVS
jgi:hypothetical protein